MRKFLTIMLSAALSVTSITALASCGGNTSDDSNNSVNAELNYSIDPSFTFSDAELGATYRPDLSGVKVIDESGTASSAFTVTIKENRYTRPDGTTAMMIGGTFVANQLGDYTVTLTASDPAVPDVEKKITVKDTTAPVLAPLNAASVPTAALIGSTVDVPSYQATDAGELVGSPVVKVLDPEGKELTVSEENTVSPATAGEHSIVVTQSDESGNEGTLTTTFYDRVRPDDDCLFQHGIRCGAA